jgi:single-strand DNA-binding protein
MNLAIFTGRLGSDIEKRLTPQGKSVANVNLAVTKRMKGENKTIWVPLTMWEKTADLAEQYLRKGSRIMVRTEFDLQDWQDKDGNKRQSPKFTVFEMEFLDSKQQSNQGQQGYQQSYQDQQAPNGPQGGYNPNHDGPTGAGQDDFIEDDIPF